MSNLKGLKLLGGDQFSFDAVDSVLQEIVESKRPKKLSGSDSAVRVGEEENMEEVDLSMMETEKETVQKRRPQVVSMPYTRKNRVQVALTALEFVQRRQEKSEEMEESRPPSSTIAHEKNDYAFDAEVEQRSKLESLAGWRKTLMTRLEMSATEANVDEENCPVSDTFDATEDLKLDIELKDILNQQYDGRLGQ